MADRSVSVLIDDLETSIGQIFQADLLITLVPFDPTKFGKITRGEGHISMGVSCP